jgi:hypothetical protein
MPHVHLRTTVEPLSVLIAVVALLGVTYDLWVSWDILGGL